MKVFVAGSTGDIGVPLVRKLVEAGHEVTGLTRSESKRPMLEALGARAAVADALDREATIEVVRRVGPDAVVHALTALPRNGPTRPSHLAATNVLRTRGTTNLLEAETGVAAYVPDLPRRAGRRG